MKVMSETPKMVGVKEVCARLGVCRPTVMNAIYRGTLPAHKLGRLWLVPVAALEALESCEGAERKLPSPSLPAKGQRSFQAVKRGAK